MAEFEVKCTECNEILNADFLISGRIMILEVDPCEKCLDDAKIEGYQERENE